MAHLTTRVLPAGVTVVPTADLDLLWRDRLAWRQHALACEVVIRSTQGREGPDKEPSGP